MLEDLRKKINEIDEKLIDLIGERAKIAVDVAKAKEKDNSALYRPDREQRIYRRIAELNNTLFDDSSLQHIFREIMSATLKLEGSLKVAALGPRGSYTNQAAVEKFGSSLPVQPTSSIDEVFDLVQKRKATYGVVPIENSIEGIVNNTVDGLLEYNLKIYTEIILPIKHNLITNAANLEEVKTVLTHPQAYAQCKKYISSKLPSVEFIETNSTSEAIQTIATSDDSTMAAIGSLEGARIYGLNVLESEIQDYQNNFTRFIVIGHHLAEPSGNDRTSIIFALPDKSGSLYKVLEPLTTREVNLTAIESRPEKGEFFTYTFYVELEGHIYEKKVKKALKQLKQKVKKYRFLGSYPVDTTAFQ